MKSGLVFQAQNELNVRLIKIKRVLESSKCIKVFDQVKTTPVSLVVIPGL